MKQLFILLVFVVFTFNIKANALAPNSLSGHWYSHSMSTSIKIKAKNNKLVVYGLEPFDRPIIFKQIDCEKYIDNRGNCIEMDCHDVIFFFPFHSKHSTKIIFDRVHPNIDYSSKNFRNEGKKNEDYENDKGYNNDNYDYAHSKNEKGKSDNYIPYKQNETWEDFINKIKGTWIVKNQNTLVAITDTRDGLKAKFSGSSNWVSYVQSKNNDYIFTDANGNWYVFYGNKNAKWVSADKNRNSIQLIKISEEVNY